MWLFQKITVQYHDAQPLLEALAQPAPLDLRVNTIKADRDTVLAELRTALKSNRRADGGPDVMATRYRPDGIRLRERTALMRWRMYKDGPAEVEDVGGQLVARLAAPRRGNVVGDSCAGAGGQTLASGS